MKIKPDYSANFYDNGIFHVYNRTNNKELLFRSTDNRLYFLKQFQKYLHPFLDTFCWNLLPNHFHFLVQIKTTEDIKRYLQSLPSQSLKPIEKKYWQMRPQLKCYLNLSGRDFSIPMQWHLINSTKEQEIFFSGHLKDWKY